MSWCHCLLFHSLVSWLSQQGIEWLSGHRCWLFFLFFSFTWLLKTGLHLSGYLVVAAFLVMASWFPFACGISQCLQCTKSNKKATISSVLTIFPPYCHLTTFLQSKWHSDITVNPSGVDERGRKKVFFFFLSMWMIYNPFPQH